MYYSSQFKHRTARIAQFFAKNWTLLTCTTVFLIIFAFNSPTPFCHQNHDSLSPELRGPSISHEMVYDADLGAARIIRRRLQDGDSWVPTSSEKSSGWWSNFSWMWSSEPKEHSQTFKMTPNEEAYETPWPDKRECEPIKIKAEHIQKGDYITFDRDIGNPKSVWHKVLKIQDNLEFTISGVADKQTIQMNKSKTYWCLNKPETHRRLANLHISDRFIRASLYSDRVSCVSQYYLF